MAMKLIVPLKYFLDIGSIDPFIVVLRNKFLENCLQLTGWGFMGNRFFAFTSFMNHHEDVSQGYLFLQGEDCNVIQ